MIIGVGNLPPDTSEDALREFLGDTHSIQNIEWIRDGNPDRLLAMVDMDINVVTAEAVQRKYHRRWWHDRHISVSLFFH